MSKEAREILFGALSGLYTVICIATIWFIYLPKPGKIALMPPVKQYITLLLVTSLFSLLIFAVCYGAYCFITEDSDYGGYYY